MMTPARNGNVPGSTPSEDQPTPLSRLEINTARPKAPVRKAVRISSARRDIIDRRPCSLDEPALLGGDPLDVLKVLLDEVVEFSAGQERIDLRRLLDVVL